MPARGRIIVVFVLLAWAVLAGRLVHLQWFQRGDLTSRATRQWVRTETIPARPGDILDCEGRLLATTVRARSLYLVPSRISDGTLVARQLGEALELDPRGLAEKLTRHADRQFVWIKRRISEAEVERVRALALPAGTWGFREEFLRQYPQGQLASHVLGLRDIDGVGRGGVEQSFDNLLRGHSGRRHLLQDARGRVVEVLDETNEAPVPGRTVTLTLDTVVQLYAERALDGLVEQWKPQSACAIVLDPHTGAVLAMASRPTFDPNRPEQVAADAWKNRVIADVYEPGSTFKPLVVAWALEKGVLQPDEVFHCGNGEYRMGRRVLHDHHPYGELNVTDILVKSSNIGMAKIGERLNNEGLFSASVTFGFGRKTGIELPGEIAGILRPLRQWNSYSTGSVPMGHELAATPLQIITAHAALANGGRLIAPHLLLYEESGSTPQPLVASRTVSSDVACWVVRHPMREVVSRGTGRRAQIDGYSVFGKTGTSQKIDETGQYSSERHVSSFLCGAPAENPRVLVLVVVDEPAGKGERFGGTVAAPAASEILKKTLVHLRVPTAPLARSEENAMNR